MKKVILLILLVLLTGCKSKKQSMKEWGEKYGIQMCEKMVTCTAKTLEKMPAQFRKMAEAKMPTKESCVAKQKTENQSREDIELTDEEFDAAKKCMEDMLNANCDQVMGNAVQSCRDYSAMMAKKAK